MSVWQSKYHNLKANYSSEWSLLPGIDKENKVIFGLIDKTDGKSYLVKIAEDVSKEDLPDEDYYLAFKEMVLNENPKNKLLSEQDVDFHGSNYHRLEFLIYTEKWGLLKQYAYVNRPGDFIIGVQLSYPVAEDKSNAEMPESMIELDKNVVL
ncbi:MAG: hypothetical protein QE487_01980 [Fluviicola sp.]|nr:hypothetical protein [Fluviicola sp.]